MLENDPEGITLAGELLDGVFECGLQMYGIIVCSDKFVSHKFQEKADQLSGDRQALWHTLRLSISHRYNYFYQHSPPSLVKPVAELLDIFIWRVLETATGLPTPGDRRLI